MLQAEITGKRDELHCHRYDNCSIQMRAALAQGDVPRRRTTHGVPRVLVWGGPHDFRFSGWFPFKTTQIGGAFQKKPHPMGAVGGLGY